MKKSLFLCCSLFLLLNSTLVFSAATTKLIDYMVSSSGLTELLLKNGINDMDAKQVGNYIKSSLGAFGDKKILTKAELTSVIEKLPVTGDDAKVRKELQVLLEKSDADIKKDDVVKAVNNIIYLANRYGDAVLITCAECVNESLAANGFKFTVKSLKEKSSTQVLAALLPNNPKDMNTFISSRVRRLGLGDYSKVGPSMIEPIEEKSLALFLSLAESGDQEFKDFAAVIKRISTKDGVTNMFNAKDQHKLWKLVSADSSPEEIAKMTSVLKEVEKELKQDSSSTEQAFNRVLKRKSEGSDELFQKFKDIKAKRCFFK